MFLPLLIQKANLSMEANISGNLDTGAIHRFTQKKFNPHGLSKVEEKTSVYALSVAPPVPSRIRGHPE
jgi:hypothetical protein